ARAGRRRRPGRGGERRACSCQGHASHCQVHLDLSSASQELHHCRPPLETPQYHSGVTTALALPGFVNAHSHAFQRRLRGRTEGGDFWEWREAMLAEGDPQTPETVRAEYAETYREMRRAGYTAVGEFHYLGLQEALAALEAASEA